MKAKGFTLIGVLIMIAIIGILVAIVYGSTIESRQWREFSVAHNCKVMQKMQADTHTGIGYASGGRDGGGPVFVTSTTPGKTAWLCDDGVTYWRND